jgi:hypothetical protein
VLEADVDYDDDGDEEAGVEEEVGKEGCVGEAGWGRRGFGSRLGRRRRSGIRRREGFDEGKPGGFFIGEVDCLRSRLCRRLSSSGCDFDRKTTVRISAEKWTL